MSAIWSVGISLTHPLVIGMVQRQPIAAGPPLAAADGGAGRRSFQRRFGLGGAGIRMGTAPTAAAAAAGCIALVHPNIIPLS